MLIVLDDAVLPADPADLSREGIDALGNLAIAAYEGNHMVTGSPRLLMRLKNLQAVLGAPTCGRYRVLSFDVNDAAQLRLEVGAYVQVHEAGHPASVSDPAHAGPDVPLIFHVGLEYFARTERIQPTRVIGEDQRDANVYQRLARAFTVHRRGFTSALVPTAGGGVNTHRVFTAQAARQIVLCVVDTDQDDPDASPKDTARFALDAGRLLRQQSCPADVVVLPCRELENMLPRALVLAALPRQTEAQESGKVERAQALLGRMDYIDLKVVASKHIVKWVDAHLEHLSDEALAEHCFPPDVHPDMSTLARTLWSFGLASQRSFA